jgi:hypothetical protein
MNENINYINNIEENEKNAVPVESFENLESEQLLEKISKVSSPNDITGSVQRKLSALKKTVSESSFKKFAETQTEKTAVFLSQRKESIVSFLKKTGVVYFSAFALANMNHQEQRPFSERDQARQELRKEGITSEQKSGYRKLASEFLYRTIDPTHYPDIDQLKYFVSEGIANNEKTRDMSMTASEDAWAMYLGLPQKNNTFDVSEFKPAHADHGGYYYTLSDRGAGEELLKQTAYHDLPLKHDDNRVLKLAEALKKAPGLSRVMEGQGDAGFMMGNFKVSAGKDEHGEYFSIYDIYDFSVPTEHLFGEEGAIGKPFEIYDRFYYNPETGEFIK